MDRPRPLLVVCALGGAFASAVLGGCLGPDSVLINVTGDVAAEQYDLYVRDDEAQKIVYHSGFLPVTLPGEPDRDITVDPLKIALKLSRGGRFTLLIVGVVGEVLDGKPAPGFTQMFWAGRLVVDGTTGIDAKLLTVQPGDDADGDLWPASAPFQAHTPGAAQLYASRPELLDCNDDTDNPVNDQGVTIGRRAADVNPFAVEVCNNGYDENCNGSGDEKCVDADKDGDPAPGDCDDRDAKRHNPTAADPFPDPPNCCGYSLGFTAEPERSTSYSGDPRLCPTKRCEDGIDNACRGADTRCVIDADCDGDPAPGDCDDANPTVRRGAQEICANLVDEDCDGVLNNGCVPCDLDGDGYQRTDAANGCPDMSDQNPGKIDCNDNDAGSYPGQTASIGGKEAGAGPAGTLTASLRGNCRSVYQSTGAVATGTAKVKPYAATLVGDADCNGVAYEGCPSAACDLDGDGWPNLAAGCNPTGGAIDCSDADPTIFPGAPDNCKTLTVQENNCGIPVPCGANDKDGDGYIAAVDCDDGDAARHPWATEVCNGKDDDCDLLVDEGNPDPSGAPMVAAGAVTQCTTSDVGECGKTKGRCVCSIAQDASRPDPMGRRMFCPGEQGGSVKPPRCFGAGQPKMQTCDFGNQRDDDCNGRNDDPAGTNLAIQGSVCGVTAGRCKAGTVIGCDYARRNCFEEYGRRPASERGWVCSTDAVCPATEACNGFDDDCNGAVGQGGGGVPDERDFDGDTFMGCSGCVADQIAPGLMGCGDCNDGVATVRPGAVETCNNVNDDCDSATPDGASDPLCASKTCCSSQSTCRDLQTGDGTLRNCGACGRNCDSIRASSCAGGDCRCGTGPACNGAEYCTGTQCRPCNTDTRCGAMCENCAASGDVCRTPQLDQCSECNVDGDCRGNEYCGNGRCNNQRPLGQSCNQGQYMGRDCSSGNCVDGRCCNVPQSMCNGCRYCNVGNGLCTNVPGGQDPHNTCSPNIPMCNGGNCNGNNSCDAMNGADCGSSCSGGNLTSAICSGGSCGTNTTPCPGNYACASSSTCRTSCNEMPQSGCRPGSTCVGGACQ